MISHIHTGIQSIYTFTDFCKIRQKKFSKIFWRYHISNKNTVCLSPDYLLTPQPEIEAVEIDISKELFDSQFRHNIRSVLVSVEICDKSTFSAFFFKVQTKGIL